MEYPGQDDAWLRRSKEKYKEAAQKPFDGRIPKEHLPSSSALGDASWGQSKADDIVPLEDAGWSPPDWNTVSTPVLGTFLLCHMHLPWMQKSWSPLYMIYSLL